jgi:competence protein ComEA
MSIKERMILGTPLDLNTMSVSDLVELPGIGGVTAANIVRDRQDNGVFRTLEDLKRVPGIGPKKIELLEPFF